MFVLIAFLAFYLCLCKGNDWSFVQTTQKKKKNKKGEKG
jgi:hypothetical protein